MEGRDAPPVAQVDAPVSDRAIGLVEPAHSGVVDLDPDPRRHRDRLAVHEHVEVGVDMIGEELLRLRLQAGLHRQVHRIGGAGQTTTAAWGDGEAMIGEETIGEAAALALGVGGVGEAVGAAPHPAAMRATLATLIANCRDYARFSLSSHCHHPLWHLDDEAISSI